ncbi:hypothetical protein RRG08_017129 [Elysia crispata]|uniref:Uncharacterized protein n=1 Tax=Elysia crispata TaxID=231223 RepID=A0AAE1DXJ4_9GAST|nr:hypothetical protein RRG08_017129 [Elysia crispata]
MSGQQPFEEDLMKRKWIWIGHTLRKPYSSISRHGLKWNPQGKRKRGRLRNTEKKDLKVDVGVTRYFGGQIEKTVQDRGQWRAFIEAVTNPHTGHNSVERQCSNDILHETSPRTLLCSMPGNSSCDIMMASGSRIRNGSPSNSEVPHVPHANMMATGFTIRNGSPSNSEVPRVPHADMMATGFSIRNGSPSNSEVLQVTHANMMATGFSIRNGSPSDSEVLQVNHTDIMMMVTGPRTQEEIDIASNNDIDLRIFGDSYNDIDIQNLNPCDVGLPRERLPRETLLKPSRYSVMCSKLPYWRKVNHNKNSSISPRAQQIQCNVFQITILEKSEPQQEQFYLPQSPADTV